MHGDEGLDYIRGYNIQGKGERQEWRNKINNSGFGTSFKKELSSPGHWHIWMGGWGECLPYHNNKISLDPHKKDQWGLPLVSINFAFGSNEEKMMDDIRDSCEEIFQKAGFSDIDKFIYRKPGGSTIHEMGTARMGQDPRTSVLNAHNQVHSVKNVFITDGSCMTSSGCQNPSLTYMALTARACDYAMQYLKNR